MSNKIYQNGYIPYPDDMKKSKFIVIPKKPGTMKFGQHRSSSLLRQKTKLLIRVTTTIIRMKIRSEIIEEALDCGREEHDEYHIHIRLIEQKIIEAQKNLFLCFIFYAKSIESINHEHLIAILKLLDIDKSSKTYSGTKFRQSKLKMS